MVSEREYFGLMKFLLHRIADLEIQVGAIKIVLNHNLSADFVDRVRAVAEDLEREHVAREWRECIDTLEIAGALETLEKYRGTVH
jgi:hypothetical protein